MPTTNVYLQGKAKWAQLTRPNQFGDWVITLYPNAESLAKIMELKEPPAIKNVLQKDEDGPYMRFKRSQNKEIRGKVVGFAPPDVLQADGLTPLREALVGNGSDVTIKLQVYPYRKGEGRAVRLESVRVDNLVPFLLKRDYDEEQLRMVKGLPEQPEQVF